MSESGEAYERARANMRKISALARDEGFAARSRSRNPPGAHHRLKIPCRKRYPSRRRRSEFATTETELIAIAPAAIIGLSARPKLGQKTPAATGMPTTL